MTYGVTTDGFVDKPIEAILDEIEVAQKAALGTDFDVTAQSPAGQINGIFSAKLREIWEVAQAVYSAIDPDKATGEGLTALAALTGTVRRAATKSTVTATVNLDAGKTLSAGAIASVLNAPNSRFVTLADATNSGGVAADISVEMEAETAGPVVANAGTLTVKISSQSGWNSITNAADADIGLEDETDEELRVRRESDLRRAGAGSVDAIRADIMAVDDVESCTGFENTSSVIDGDGLPPHSFEMLVLGGTDNDVAQAIWDSKPAGIQAYGTTNATATDTNGASRTISFTRPTEVPIYIDVSVTVDANYPADGDDQIKAAIAAWAQEVLLPGVDVVLTQLYPIVFGISGVVDVTLIEIDTSAPPGGTANIAIGVREMATIDTADITVVAT